ncbi:MAG: hypothetical protein K5837_03175 [Candidatus Saccharibacteria bacterium]|nr:hypothetical protein [Candidatus Saccharibacteria bacterium]
MIKELFTPKYAPCILAVNVLFLAGCLCLVHDCFRKYIPSQFEKCKKHRKMRDILRLAVSLVGTIILIVACLHYSLFIGIAVYLLGFGDFIAYALRDGGVAATVTACIVGWHKRVTKDDKSHARDR